MIDWILRTKAWVLFVLIYVLPYFASATLMSSAMGTILTQPQSPEEVFAALGPAYAASFAVWLLPTALLFTWIYAVSDRLAPVARPYVAVSPSRMKALTIAIGAFFAAYFAVMLWMLSIIFGAFTSVADATSPGAQFPGTGSPFGVSPELFVVVYLGLTLASLVFVGLTIYLFVQVARTIRALEYRGRRGSEGVVGAVFALLFFFVGVWILQPVVNQLAARGTAGEFALEDGLIE